MFRDDRQIALANRALCARIPRLRDAWTAEGPSRQSVEWFESDGGPLSLGERTMLLASFTFWNGGLDTQGKGKLRFEEVLSLDGDHMRALAELMIASTEGVAAVDAWIRKWGST